MAACMVGHAFIITADLVDYVDSCIEAAEDASL